MATLTGNLSATFEWNGWQFEHMDNGHIFCGVCDTRIWCIHIQKMVQANGDTGAFSLLVDLAAAGEMVIVEVPMFPTSNIWQRVTLARHEKLRAFKVYMAEADEQNPFTYFLGFVNPGEGRNVLRSMMFDWFKGMVEVDNLMCKSPTHGLAAQMRWERETLPISTMRLPNLFCVWKYGNCISCYTKSDDDFADLIPDAGDGGKKPWEK